MLTIDDLAKRWGVSTRKARAIVVRGGVPRIELAPGRHISWKSTRFDPADVEAWEESRKTAGAVAAPPVTPARVKPRGGRPAVPDRVGRW